MTTHSEQRPHTSRQSSFQRFFLSLWYRSPLNRHLLSYFLLPLSYLLNGIASLRRCIQSAKANPLPVPIVVVGNLSVGGTGKTPVVIALVKALQEKGFKVGVISRGYGSQAPHYPFAISADTSVKQSGDEALLIAQTSACPVVLDKDRQAAAQHLIKTYPNTQVIISDDGLQHYRLPRQLELVVVDGERGFGNGLCIPAGPLREKANRLASVNWVLINGQPQHDSLQGSFLKDSFLKNSFSKKSDAQTPEQEVIHLQPRQWRNIKTGQILDLETLPWNLITSNITKNNVNKGNLINSSLTNSNLLEQDLLDQGLTEKNVNITALAAIGNPERFFHTLRALAPEEKINTIAFDDHHAFSEQDFNEISNEEIVLMTAKDAVKCRGFARENWWALEVSLSLPSELLDDIVQCVH